MPMDRACRPSKVTLILVGAYTTVSVAILLYVFYVTNFTASTAELVGVPLIVLALPWSFIFMYYSPDSANLSLMILTVFIGVNDLILYVITRAIEDRSRGG